MLQGREMVVLGVAFFIDALQALLELALFVMFTVAPATTIGTAAGAAACGANCAKVGAGVGVIGDLIPFTHGLASAALAPLGMGIGFALDVSVSITFGAIFILLLISFNMFYPMYVFGGSIFELIPGLDILPGWTALAWASIRRKRAEEKQLAGVKAVAKSAYQTVRAMNDAKNQVRIQNYARAQKRDMDGITPPQTEYAA